MKVKNLKQKPTMSLTSKQEKFCQAYVLKGDKSAAYREAYSSLKMKPETINRKAVELFENGKITARVRELQTEVRKKEQYNLEASIRRDLKLIERYEKALDILERDDSEEKAVEAAERMIKFIGANGYNSAQERLSKQHGFYEKDNEQSNPKPERKDLSHLSLEELKTLQALMMKAQG